jgi:hypothetical protein
VLRFSGPWREAQARLAGRRAGTLTRWSNRFWIGEARLPFAGAAAGFDPRAETSVLK